MIRLAIIAALTVAPAFASTVEDPDSPRFAEGLRVLGMRGEVKIERVTEVARFDPEPLYIARSPEREAFFRAGEDMCMAKGKLGLFVACDDRLAAEVARVIQPVVSTAVPGWSRPPVLAPRHGGDYIGGGWYIPPAGTPPHNPPAPPPAPIPLPAAGYLLAAALLLAGAARTRADKV